MTDRKLTIDDLEKLLDAEDDIPIEILPNGTIRAAKKGSKRTKENQKVLTFRENLGGEYFEALNL